MGDIIHVDLSKIDTDISTLENKINELIEEKKFLEQFKRYSLAYIADSTNNTPASATENNRSRVNGTAGKKATKRAVTMNDRILNIATGVERTTRQVIEIYAEQVGKNYSEINRNVSKAIHVLHKQGKLITRPITKDNPKAGSYIIKAE